MRQQESKVFDDVLLSTDSEQIAAAGAKLIKPDRIALNPDCGFAPDAGEPPTIDEAFEKLSRLSTAAARLRKKHTSTTRSHD